MSSRNRAVFGIYASQLDAENAVNGLKLAGFRNTDVSILFPENTGTKDLAVQGKYGVRYLKYWYDAATGKVFCLSEAPSKEAALAVHREAHGMMPDDIFEVQDWVADLPGGHE